MLQQTLDAAEQDFLASEIVKVFEWHRAVEKIAQVTRGGKVLTMADKRQELEWLNQLRACAIIQHQTAEKFRTQLARMLAPGKQADHTLLLDRTLKAAEWFSTHIDQGILGPVKEHVPDLRKLKAKKYIQRLEEIQLLFLRKRQEVSLVPEVARALAEGLSTQEIMNRVTAVVRPPQVALPPESHAAHQKERGASRHRSLELYREGKTVTEIAAERNLTDSTIFTHLASFIMSGEVDVRDLVTEENLTSAIGALRADPGARISEIRQNLAMTIPYDEIRAASLYLKKLEAQQAASPASQSGRG